MALTNDLISQFVKATSDSKREKKEETLYGTAVVQNGTKYVKLDGSSLLTPISSTANVLDGERVTVMIKNHTAVITGNLSSPSARVGDLVGLDEAAHKIEEFEIIIAKKADAEALTAANGRIDSLVTDNTLIRQTLEANTADINDLTADNVEIKKTLTANTADIETLKTTKLDVDVADAKYVTTENLEATNVAVNNLAATYSNFVSSTAEQFEATDATIENLVNVYAAIDFSNIGKAAMEYFYANSGLIEDVVVGDGTITGMLAGVTIKGDLLEANTVVADKLVIKGEDGLYYKLNTDGIDTTSEQTEYNSINGKIILAKSITATQIAVDDLVAFDATIGGFTITDSAIYSEIKDSEGNHTRGIYLDKDGQINFGDDRNFIRYYMDEDGVYRLAISADSILYDVNGNQYSISDLGHIGEYIKIDTYEDEPCIELGETDSDFKLLITNTRMIFKDGTSILAYFTNKSLYINKAVIEEELQQGGFIWKARSNGNMGLVWKGVE